MKAVKQTVRKYYKYDYSNPQANIDITGELTFNDGVLSGFSNGYGKIYNDSFAYYTPFVVNLKITPQSRSRQTIFNFNSDGTWVEFEIYSNGCFALLCNNYSGSWHAYSYGNYSVTVNTTYWIQIEFDGSKIYLKVSTDGETYTTSITLNLAELSWTTPPEIYLGAFWDGSQRFSGTIDLNECNINLNSQRWWNGIYYPIIEGTPSDYDFYKDIPIYKSYFTTSQKFHPYVYEYTETGTYEITLPEDDYEVELYGAGGGAAICGYNTYYTNRGGGSGAGFKGTIHIPAGTYTISVGSGGSSSSGNVCNSGNGGDTSISNIVTAGGGLGAYISYNSYADDRYGKGGTLTIDNSIIVGTPEIQSDGIQGDSVGYVYGGYDISVYGGTSIYDETHNGYGAGGSYNKSGLTSSGYNGYLKITAINQGYYTTEYKYKALKL